MRKIVLPHVNLTGQSWKLKLIKAVRFTQTLFIGYLKILLNLSVAKENI